MSSYRNHILFSLIFTFPFFPDIYYLSLGVIGASLVDLDSKYRNKNLLIIGLSGCLLTLLLQFLNIPLFPGLILITLALIFFISKHRGFMHSFIGIILGALLLSIFIFSFLMLLQFLQIFYIRASLFLTSAFLAIMILNKKLVIPYILVLSLGILLTPIIGFNIYFVFGSVLLGSLSHLILDLFTPKGVKIFKPFLSRKMGKTTGIILFAIWVAGIILFYGFNFLDHFFYFL